jgi:Plasmid replication region DNA-binding N-term
MSIAPKRYGESNRGVAQADVSQAADALLRVGERPTADKVRKRIGRGSPNTIYPLLDEWWSTLTKRLEGGAGAVQRLPEAVAHVAEALWINALEEARVRVRQELDSSLSAIEIQQNALEVRSHVLTLREGELDSRLRDRDGKIRDLQIRLREGVLALKKSAATEESLRRQVASLTRKRSGFAQQGKKALSVKAGKQVAPQKKANKRR